MLVIVRISPPNDQFTDGGPSEPPELPTGVAGPPFDAAPGSASFTIEMRRSIVSG